MEEISKFDTCRFRSPEKQKLGRKWCCGNTLREAYVCLELNIEDLTKEICENCNKYEPRIEDGQTQEG